MQSDQTTTTIIHESDLDNIIKTIFANCDVSQLNVQSIQTFVPRIMEYIEKQYQNVSGEQKKQIVIAVVQRVTNLLPHDSQEKSMIDDFVTHSLPTVIDVIVSVSKGLYELQPIVVKGLKACLAFCGSKTKKQQPSV